MFWFLVTLGFNHPFIHWAAKLNAARFPSAIMKFEMRHLIPTLRGAVLALSVAAVTALSATPAHSQSFNANQLAGKTRDQITKMLGAPLWTADNLSVAEYKLPGSIRTRIFYSNRRGSTLRSVEIYAANRGETYQDILKRFSLNIGSDPRKTFAPEPTLILHSRSQPDASPWGTIGLARRQPLPASKALLQWLKDQGQPAHTPIWTITLTPRRTRGVSNRVQSGP